MVLFSLYKEAVHTLSVTIKVLSFRTNSRG